VSLGNPLRGYESDHAHQSAFDAFQHGNSGNTPIAAETTPGNTGVATAAAAELPEFPEGDFEGDFENFVVDSNAGPLTAYWIRATGTKKGAAVFVPGFTGSKEDFRLLLPALAALGWDAVAYSQRGQYESAAPVGVEYYTLTELAADAANLALTIFEHCGGELIHVVGHSLGGLVARQAVLIRPDLFASLTMLCSGPGGRDGSHEDDGQFVAAHGPLALWERNNPDGAQTAEQRMLRDRAAASSTDAYLGGVRILQDTVDSTPALAATGVPTLVAHGDADDAWPIAAQRAMATELDADYAVIPAAGHSPNLDNPDFTARTLSDFWTSNS